MSNQRLRVGVIGAGIGAIHLSAYSQIPEVEVVALAGRCKPASMCWSRSRWRARPTRGA
jgi:hypothetical protein